MLYAAKIHATVIYKIDDLPVSSTVKYTLRKRNNITNLLASISNLTVIWMLLVNMFFEKFQIVLHVPIIIEFTDTNIECIGTTVIIYARNVTVNLKYSLHSNKMIIIVGFNVEKTMFTLIEK